MLHWLHVVGLPDPETEYQFAKPRRWKCDMAYPAYKVVIECEGATWLGKNGRHTSGAGYAADCLKYNEAGYLGWCVLRFTSAQIEYGNAAAMVLRTLRARGYGTES